MKAIYIFLFVFFTYSLHIAHASVEKLFLSSLEKSKLVEIISLTEKGTLSQLKTTVSSLYPDLDIVSVNRYGDKTNQRYSGLKRVDTNLALSLEKSIFQGGAEFALLDLKKIVPDKAKAFTSQELAAYFSQFSTYYFQVSSAIEEQEKVEGLLKNLEKRVGLVRKRAKIGRDREADLLALESQLARLKADLFETKSNLSQAKTNFLNFSGLDSIDNIEDKIDPLKLKLSANAQLDSRPELENLRFDYEVSLAEAKIEKAAYYPQVSLGANYYLDKSYLGRDNWDVSVNIKMNLFDFGKTSSSVKTKNVQALINRARFDFNRINATEQWKNFVASFDLKKNEFIALKRALSKSSLSYEAQIRDLSKGLVTQLDVIRSLDDVIELQKLTIKTSLELKSLYYQANAYLGNYPKP